MGISRTEDVYTSQNWSELLRNLGLISRLHDQAGSTSWLYVSWKSQLDVCSIV